MLGVESNTYEYFFQREFVCRGSETQIQVGENFNYLI